MKLLLKSDDQRDPHREEPQGPRDVEDRDHGSCESPAILLLTTQELTRADDQAHTDDDPDPPHPGRYQCPPDDGDAGQDGPDSREEISEMLADTDAEVLMHGTEDGDGGLSLSLSIPGSALVRASEGTR